MSTLLGERIQSAIAKKSEDINTYIWKGNKTIGDDKKYQQSETRLVDMNNFELSKCYNHCKAMLFNKSNQNPGRHLVLEIIKDQKNRCGVELFLRHLEQDRNMSRFTLRGLIGDYLSENKEFFDEGYIPKMKDIFDGMPNEYEFLSLDVLMDGCLDKLGVLNKKHLTRTFILRQGIWLTSEEANDLIEFKDGKQRDRLEVIRERFNLKPVDKLFINSKGMDYSQMRAMLNLKPNIKYTNLTTIQLNTLRNKILFNFEEVVHRHITAWEGRMAQIEKVAEYKGFIL